MSKRKIVDARENKDGRITAVKIQGNSTFTSVETAIRMAERKEIDAVVVTHKSGTKHLRTRPDGNESNNLNDLAKD